MPPCLDLYTGYWRLVKTEEFEEFLIALGVPWVVRKAAIRFGGGNGSAVEFICSEGKSMTVTTLNAKGSWTRLYDTTQKVTQKTIDGAVCITTSWFEGHILRTHTQGSSFGAIESCRHVKADTMVVRTTIGEATMYWYFDRMTSLQQHLAMSGHHSLKRQISIDRSRVERATSKDSIRKVLLDFPRWATPADQFIILPHNAGLRTTVSPSSMSTGQATPKRSASAVSLSQLHNAQETSQVVQRPHQMKKEGAASAASRTVSGGLSPNDDEMRSPSSKSASPIRTSPSRAPTGTEALMAYKISEFLDARAITSVVPVLQPNDTTEPELLEMSPEQAEETAAKLKELEHELLLGRQESAKGCVCCGLVLTRQSQTLPEHLRVWEMTL